MRLKRLDLFLSADGALLVAGEQIVMEDLVKKARAEQIVKVRLNVDEGTPYAKVLEIIRIRPFFRRVKSLIFYS